MTLTYTGEKQPRSSKALHQADYYHEPPTVDESRLRSYKPLPDLVEAVNLAIYLERPLLLRGEPGCGKTRLAEMVAFELGLPYFTWHIQSTTQARDGLYTYDAVRRLHDVQLATKELPINSDRDPTNVNHYIDYGPLGQAFRYAHHDSPNRPVVLIDEIDKADLDFPNDLLLALDESRFRVTESGEEVAAQVKPIIFITSNDEKELPDAFLRRCLFFYIELPPNQLEAESNPLFDYLQQIVQLHHPPKTDHEISLISAAVDRFVRLRRQMTDARKKASTSELLDWYLALFRDDDALQRLASESLPHAEALLKTRIDFLRYRTMDDG